MLMYMYDMYIHYYDYFNMISDIHSSSGQWINICNTAVSEDLLRELHCW